MKPRPDLIPPVALLAVGHVLAAEAGESWNEGRWANVSTNGHLACAMRHVLEHLAGRTIDPVSREPHLAHAGARILYAIARHLGAP